MEPVEGDANLLAIDAATSIVHRELYCALEDTSVDGCGGRQIAKTAYPVQWSQRVLVSLSRPLDMLGAQLS